MIGLESDEVNPKKSVGQRKGRMSNGKPAERRLMTKRTIITLMILMTDSLKSRDAKRIQKSVDQKKGRMSTGIAAGESLPSLRTEYCLPQPLL